MGVQSRGTGACCANRSFSFRRVSETVPLSAIIFTILLSSPAFAQPPIKVEWKVGRLSVSAERIPLSSVLREVARQTGVEIQGLEELQQEVFVDFSNVSLCDGLESLLSHVDHAIVDNASRHGITRPTLVVIFSRGPTARQDLIVSKGALKATNPLAAEALQGSAIVEEAEAEGQTDQQKQLGALQSAATQGDEETLRKAILDPDPLVQGTALEALAQKDRQGAIDILLSAAKSDQSGQRLEALQRLDQSGLADQATVLPLLREALGDQDPSIRGYAVQSLAARGGADVMSYLRQALRDQDPSVRLMVIGNVAQKDEGLPLLQEALSDPDESVRTSASTLLEQAVSEGY